MLLDIWKGHAIYTILYFCKVLVLLYLIDLHNLVFPETFAET